MASKLVLYDNVDSSNGCKVRFLLGELGVPFEVVVVPLDNRPDWYRDVHPFNTVPCLVDGDLVIVESNTILRYLADREGREDLYPRDPARRARVDQLLDALSLAVRPALWDLELAAYYESADAATVAAAAAALRDVLVGWERLIEPDGYVTGQFSIADIAATARMWLLPQLPLDSSVYPRTGAMLARVGARPAFTSARDPGEGYAAGAPAQGRHAS